MNVRVISRNIGIALIFNAIFMFISVFVSVLNDFDSSFSPLLLSAILTFTVGIFPVIFVNKQGDINTREGLAIVSFSWLLSCIFGMIPYVLWGGEFSLINAWFESASGFTTTGATILTNIEIIPKGLLFWRSSTHFIGGLGVVLFMMMILPSIGSVKFRMSRMEVSDISKVNYKFKTNQLVRVVVSVYMGLNLVLIAFLVMAGMTFFDAVNHAFSTVATGGFSTKTSSIAAFDSLPIEIIIMVFMILSSLHFGLIYTSVVGRNFKVFKNPITKFYLMTIIVSVLIVAVNLINTNIYDSTAMAFRQSFFFVISAASSTGFAISEASGWPVFSLLILIYLMIQSGCSGSTVGGIKADRVWILVKAINTQLRRTMHPNAVIPVKFGNNVADKDFVSSISLFVILYMFFLFICAVIYSALGMDLIESLSSSASLLGNVGPAFGRIGTLGSYSMIPAFGKFIMGVEMITGRLGLYSLLILFMLFRRRN